MEKYQLTMYLTTLLILSGCAPDSKNKTVAPDLKAIIQGYDDYINCTVKTFENSNESFSVSIQKKTDAEEYIFSSSYYVIEKNGDSYSTSQKQTQLNKVKIEKNEETNIVTIYNSEVTINNNNPVIAVFDENAKILVINKNETASKVLDCAAGKYITNE